MALSLEELTTVDTVDAALELILSILESEGFPARSWQEGSVNRTEVEYLAQLLSSNSELIATITKGGFNSLAVGAGLTQFSESSYDNEREEAVRTQGLIQLTVEAGSGPYTPGVGEVIVLDPVRNLRYRNLNALSLSSAAIVTDVFEAEVAGTDGNDPVAGDINVLVSALAGVTIVNVGSPWPTLNGADQEGDPELQTRNTNKWATLSEAGPKGIYIFWALAADAAVTRVSVDDTNSAGTGAVVVYIADADAGLGAPTDAAVLAYILERRPLGATVTVLPAVSLEVPVAYTATYDPTVYSSDVAAVAAIDAAINSFRSTFPIGGVGKGEIFTLGGLYTAANAVIGIVNVTFAAPTADTPMTISQVIVYPAGTLGTATPV